MLKKQKLEYKKHTLDKELKNVVKYVWTMKSHEAIQTDFDLLIPDGYPEIIFVLDGAYCKKSLNEKDDLQIIKNSCLVGIQTQSVLAKRIHNCHLIGLKLFPWAAYRLFGNQLNLSANQNISTQKLGLKWLFELNEQLQVHHEGASILNSISETLNHQLKKQDEDKSWNAAEAYIKTILEMEGQISVQELAHQHCLSIRHFQRTFKKFYGISPKKFINIIRFKKLYKASVLQKKMPDRFLDFGYYDQTHFIRDFQKQLGITPSKSIEKTFIKLNEMARINS